MGIKHRAQRVINPSYAPAYVQVHFCYVYHSSSPISTRIQSIIADTNVVCSDQPALHE